MMLLLFGIIGGDVPKVKYRFARYEEQVVWDACDPWETPAVAVGCPRNYTLKLPFHYGYRYYTHPFMDIGYWYSPPGDRKNTFYKHGMRGRGWITTPRLIGGKVAFPRLYKHYLPDDRR